MRAPAVESDGSDRELWRFEHGAPVLRRGRRLAGTRDVSFLSHSDVRSIKAVHVAVVTDRCVVAGGMRWIAAACDAMRVLRDETLLRTAAWIELNGRCRRPAWRNLFLVGGSK